MKEKTQLEKEIFKFASLKKHFSSKELVLYLKDNKVKKVDGSNYNNLVNSSNDILDRHTINTRKYISGGKKPVYFERDKDVKEKTLYFLEDNYNKRLPINMFKRNITKNDFEIKTTIYENDVLIEVSKGVDKLTAQKIVMSKILERDPKLKKEILKIWKDRCGIECPLCGKPMWEKKDGFPYTEIHHIKFLSDNPGKNDNVENLIPLCPDCHKKSHYSKNTESIKNKLITIRKKWN